MPFLQQWLAKLTDVLKDLLVLLFKLSKSYLRTQGLFSFAQIYYQKFGRLRNCDTDKCHTFINKVLSLEEFCIDSLFVPGQIGVVV